MTLVSGSICTIVGYAFSDFEIFLDTCRLTTDSSFGSFLNAMVQLPRNKYCVLRTALAVDERE
jgi:hypothetical protein